MKPLKTLRLLVYIIAVLALAATATGIFSQNGPGPYEFTSIHGQAVKIYGKGIYQHMSAEVAPQGIAQDVVSLCIGLPLLMFSLWLTAGGSRKGRFLLLGTLGYFLVTYLFYMLMAMYNPLFLLYVTLASLSFFALAIGLRTFKIAQLESWFSPGLAIKPIGGFLMVNSLLMALLWLSRIVPTLLSGTIPPELEHYTTMVVQGLDLAFLLPLGFIAGLFLAQRKAMGYLIAPVYLVFLSILMSALTAKVVAMAMAGFPVLPVIIIIPLLNLATLICTTLVFRHIKEASITGPGIFQQPEPGKSAATLSAT